MKWLLKMEIVIFVIEVMQVWYSKTKNQQI